MNRSAKLTAGIALVLAAMAAQVVVAQEATEEEAATLIWIRMDFSFSGMVRSETAFQLGSQSTEPAGQRLQRQDRRA